MFNNLIQKSVAGTVALSIVLMGVSSLPMLAQAQEDNGLHMGLEAHAKVNAGISDQDDHPKAAFNGDEDLGLGLGNLNVDMKGSTSASDGNAITTRSDMSVYSLLYL